MNRHRDLSDIAILHFCRRGPGVSHILTIGIEILSEVVSSSGLRDTDNLWFDGMHSCKVDDKARFLRGEHLIDILIIFCRLSGRTIRYYYRFECLDIWKTISVLSQGLIASGLGVLYAATGNTTYLDEAEKTLDAAASRMISNKILKEICDDPVNSTCDTNQVIPHSYGSGVSVLTALSPSTSSRHGLAPCFIQGD